MGRCMIAKIKAGPVGVDFARPEEETRRVKKAEAIGESYIRKSHVFIHAYTQFVVAVAAVAVVTTCVGNPHPSVHPSACARV